MDVCMNMCTHVCMYMCMYACLLIWMYVCMYSVHSIFFADTERTGLFSRSMIISLEFQQKQVCFCLLVCMYLCKDLYVFI